MELDRRVTELETELKIIKGEVKGLLVDIRDLMNRTENPFCNIQSQGAPEIEVAGKKNPEKGQRNALQTVQPAQETPSGEIPKQGAGKQEIPAQEIPQHEMPGKEMHKQENESSLRREIDTFTLVELMRWVDYSIRTIGRSKLEELLNLCILTGQLSEEVKAIIENIANLSIEEPAEEGRVSMKDNIMVLSQLNAILNPGESRRRIQPSYEDKSGGWDGDKREKKTGLIFN